MVFLLAKGYAIGYINTDNHLHSLPAYLPAQSRFDGAAGSRLRTSVYLLGTRGVYCTPRDGILVIQGAYRVHEGYAKAHERTLENVLKLVVDKYEQMFYSSIVSRTSVPNKEGDFIMDKSEKLKALDAAIAQIERQYGKGAVMKLGDQGAGMNVEAIPTGSLSLDLALGIGGIPKGRIVEIYGPESSGKTTVTLHMIAEVQKRGGIAGFIDAEHALDPVYAKNIGVDIDNLYISQPDCGEQALEIAETMVRSGAIDIVVVDSVAALVPKQEIDGDMGDAVMGAQARLMSQAMRKLTAVISKSNCTVVFINQLREKLGVMFGNPETTTGGRALKFYSSVRLDVRKTETLKNGTEVIGNHVRVKIVKNKVAPPFKEAEFDILYGQGISREGSIIDLAVENNIIDKSGAWFAYKGQKIGQGKENARQYLIDNPDICGEIEELIRDSYKPADGSTYVDDVDIDDDDQGESDDDILGIDM